MDNALARLVSLERQRVMDLAAMARAVELLSEQRVQEAVTELLDRLYTHWGYENSGGRDHENEGITSTGG